MINVRIAVYLVCIYLVQESSTFLNLQPARFARERYQRSRNRTAKSSILVKNENQIYDFVAIVNHYGYLAEEHLVMTLDGYRLRVHRIPGGPSSPKAAGKPVVYMQHGLLGSSDTWVLMGPNKDLVYMLVDAGYDVWIGNARGNTYSRSHVRFSPDYDPAFWEFSYHEIAVFDVTATIDYLLHTTNQSKLVYIGHSMGTSLSYVLLSMRPEYNEKMYLVISLAPVAFWHAPLSPFIRFLKDNTPAIKSFVLNSKTYEMFPLTAFNAHLAQASCSNNSIFQKFCLDIISFISGSNPKQLNASLVPTIASYFPAGTSAQVLIHYSQNIATGDFSMYDYGVKQNLARYGQYRPPSYDLRKIIAPIALFYGNGDEVVSPGDPIELSKKLPNVMTIEALPDTQFSHIDFLFARDVKTLLNDHILELIEKVLR